MTKNQLGFAVFCIENVAEHLGLNGGEVYEMLTRDSKILDEYIIEHYEPLHTQGKEYIVNDIVEYMQEVGLVS